MLLTNVCLLCPSLEMLRNDMYAGFVEAMHPGLTLQQFCAQEVPSALRLPCCCSDHERRLSNVMLRTSPWRVKRTTCRSPHWCHC